MNAIQATAAMIAHLQTMPARPALAYPSGPVVKELPRIVIDIPTAPHRNITIKGRGEGTAQIVLRIETEDGQFTTEADSIATLILARFATTTRIDGVTIVEPPTVQARYRSDGVFYMPILVQGRFYSNPTV